MNIFVDYGENIHIGNNVEINMNCVFLNSNCITMRDRTTVDVGSVVTHSIHEGGLAVGNPCRVIRNL